MSDQQRLGRYMLDRKIATGGMAEIWLAHQAGPAGFAKELVIKRILPHLADDTKFVEMFLDEARLAATLQHPNIAQIFDLGEIDGSYFIAMEYIEGYDLEVIIQRAIEIERFVSPPIAARLIADACAGLDYAHTFQDRDGREVGLVHRDISPQNLLVSRNGIVKVVDFGVAKAATSSHKTQTGAVKGKLSYMSPEQISAQPLDGRSDLFSLGIVLYELVTNQRPFGHESELMAVTAILNQEPRAPRTLTAAVPEELEHIIYRALAKNRDERFASASEMQLALEQYLQHHGALLTTRDVAAYLADIFSANPSGTVPALERRAGAALGVGGTVGGVMSTHTRPHASAGTQTMVRDGVDADDVQPVRSGRGALVAVFLLVAAVLAGAGFGISRLLAGDASTQEAVADAGQAALDAESEEADDDAPSNNADASAGTAANIAAQADVAGAAPPLVGTDIPPVQLADSPDAGVATALDAETDPASSEIAEIDAAAIVPVEVDAGLGDPSAEDSSLVALADEQDAAEPLAPDVEALAAEDVQQAPPTPDPIPAADVGRERPDPPPVRRDQPGTVRVTVTTGGTQTVYIDGSQVGRLPGRSSFQVAPGRRTIRIVNADGTEHTETVEVPSGGSSSVRVRF